MTRTTVYITGRIRVKANSAMSKQVRDDDDDDKL